MALDTLMAQASIVFIGSFNPKIFHPEWLISKQIIGKFDYDLPSQTDFVIAHDIAQFSMPDDIQIQVVGNRFNLKSYSVDSYKTIGDMAASIISILSETPVYQMGLNLTLDIAGFTQSEWKKIGEELVHLELFKTCLGIEEDCDWEENNGLKSIAVILPVQTGKANEKNLRLSLSPRAKQYKVEKDHVLEVDINTHYRLEQFGAKVIPNIIMSEWSNVLDDNTELVKKVLQRTVGNSL